MSTDKFHKRAGTTDEGKLYENLLAAYYSLRLAINDEIEEFKISSNDDKFGIFDDLVVEVNRKNGTNEQFNIQAKHTTKKKTLRLDALKGKGQFSIRKYLDEFKKSQNGKKCKLLLFTNRSMELNNDFELDNEQCDTIYISHHQWQSDCMNTTISKQCNIFKFRIKENREDSKTNEIYQYKEFFKNFFLYTGQKNVNELRASISKIFQDSFRSDESCFKNYLDFINNWCNRAGKKHKLDKEFIRLKIAECLLSPYILPLSEAKCTEKSNLLKEAIDKFDITLTSHTKSAREMYRPNEVLDEDIEGLNHIGIKYQIIRQYVKHLSELNPQKRAILLWLSDKCPLILKVTDSTEDLIFQAMNLCQWNEKKKKFILLGTKKRTWNTLHKLSDLYNYRNIYDKITAKFTCCFQGRTACIRDIIDHDEEIRNVITVDQLIEMLDDCLDFGGPKEILPEHYIDRSLTKIVLNFDCIDKLSDVDPIVISCTGKFDIVKQHVQNANFLIVDDCSDYLNSPTDKTLDFFNKNNIYVATNVCNPELFEKICEKQTTRPCHHFRVSDGNNLEWLDSHGNIENLRQYKSDNFVKETEMFDANRINIICGDSGMGKSMMMLNLKNNYPSKFWVIKIKLREYFELFEKSRNHEQFLDKIIATTKLNEFEVKLIQILKKTRKIVLIWDGLDEITKIARDNVLNVIDGIRRLGFVQWITARTSLQTVLEEKFNVFSKTIKPFDEIDQLIYIKKRLNTNNDPDKVAAEIMKKVGKDNLRVPLQIFMLTELFRQNDEKCRTLLTNAFSITDLIGHFVEEKFNFFYRKANIDVSNNVAKLIVEEHKNYRLECYEMVALNLCLDPSILKQLNLKNCEKCLATFREENDYLGMVEVTNNSPNFAHRSYAEYFVALWLSNNYRKIPNLDNFFFDDSFRSVRFMFDLILAQDCPAHVAVLHKSFEGLKSHTNKISLKDKAGRSPLHIGASWGETHFLLNTKLVNKIYIIDTEKGASVKEDSREYKQIIDYLVTKCNVKEKDNLFKIDCLQYADRSLSLSPIETISKSHTINFDNLNNFKDLPTVLYYLIKFDYSNLFKLIKMPYVETNTKVSLLHLIASHNRAKFLTKVLQNQRYRNAINKTDQKFWAPIHYASYSGSVEMITQLRKVGGDIHLGTKKAEETPLFVAAQYGQLKVARYLIDNGVNVNLAKKNGWTPLMMATQRLHFTTIILLVRRNADVNAVNGEGNGSLHIAARKGSLMILKFLILKKATVNIINKHGETPLYMASRNGHLEVGQFLIRSGARVGIVKTSGWTVLMAATKNGHFPLVKLLIDENHQLDNNSSINSLLSKLKWNVKDVPSPLHIAAGRGYLDIVEFLIQKGADVNATTSSGCCPLHKASEKGHLMVVKVLLKHGAKINAVTENGCTPLYKAAEKGHVETVEFLVGSKSDVNIFDKNGNSPLDIAAKNRHEKVVRYFQEHKIYEAEISRTQIYTKTGNHLRQKWIFLVVLIILTLLVVLGVTNYFIDALINKK